jgi:NAD(P)-dependent dehydrogenase (short-subunit alcohol dehydrogenase family)
VAGANGGLGGSTIYGSTKAALRSFGRTIAKELTPRGIRVNTISPGPIITPILDKGGLTPAQKDNFIEGAKTRIPLGRTGTAAEVAAAALYLAADATYTTGAELLARSSAVGTNRSAGGAVFGASHQFMFHASRSMARGGKPGTAAPVAVWALDAIAG